ncbi:Hypothetical protein SRAE_2000221700 [Strongyloides ratti]|uniref:Katanin_con80 domain-containing protein n=1 Tax=Strongyloides ratti TaxID=34506 RepID=A0A090LJ49_STRRB|nr:Hypothetical protein SRAE_2000221700 [Strongyloides ratti]CEF67555.1 Hypothetical protein SRAE_2000221700 [Strongyloides ratti]
MENVFESSSPKKDNSLSYMGSGSSKQANTLSSIKSKNVKKFSSKNNNYSLRNRSASVGNLKGKIKNELPNGSLQRNRSVSKKERNNNNNLISEIIIPKFAILSRNCISTNVRDLEQLDIISSKILNDGLGIILSFRFRNNYFIDIVEAVTENEKLWCIENVELLIPQLLALIMSKSIKNKRTSLNIIQRIIKDFSDAISSNNKVGKKVKEGLLQILVNEPMILINMDKAFQKDMAFCIFSQESIITPFDNKNINAIDFICDKSFFEECTLVLGQCCNKVTNEFQTFPKTIANKNQEMYFYESCETSFAQCIRLKYVGFCNVYYQLTQYLPIYIRSLLKRIGV